MNIYQKPYFAPFLGPKVFKLIEAGLEIEPENPRIHYLIGVSYLFIPKYLGGAEKKGLTYLLKAHNFFEKEADIKPRPFEPRWGHGTCLDFIGKAYIKLNKSKGAENYFKKALTINPKDKLAKSGLDEFAKQKGK
jgi:tetratricopeptide (TPR) repeat protein